MQDFKKYAEIFKKTIVFYCIVLYIYIRARETQKKRGEKVEKQYKHKEYKTYYMERENLIKLDEYSANTSLKKTTVVNMAVKEFFERRSENGEGENN
jgi:hypothetical protein